MAGPWERYAAPQRTQVKPADQRLPYQLQQEAGQAAAAPYAAPKAAADLQRTQQQISLDAQTAPADIANKQAQARKNEIEARVLEQTGGAGVEQSKAAGFYNRASNSAKQYDSLKIGAPTIGREIAQTLLPDSLVNKFTDNPRQAAEALERDFVAATLRYESGAAIPPEELESQRRIFFPSPGDSPETIALKAQLRSKAIESLKIGAGPAANQVDGEVTRDGVQMYRDPQTGEEIPTVVGGSVGSPHQKNMAQANGLDAFGEGAVDMLTFGLRDELGAAGNAFAGSLRGEGSFGNLYDSNVTDLRQYQGSLQERFAPQYMGGQILGGVAGGLGTGLAAQSLARGGSAIGRGLAAGGGIGADVAYGGAYGAGAGNENRLGGAMMGAGMAGLGNVAGQAVFRGAAGGINPSGGNMAPLYNMGVRPSIGQRMGGYADRAEQALQSVPIVGAAIRGTRQRARDQFQTGLFDDALGDIGQTLPRGVGPGREAHKFAQDAFDQAYDQARAGMTAVADPDLGSAIGVLQQRVGGLRPTSQTQFGTIWRDAVARRFQNGQLSGDGYKAAMSEMGKKVAAIRKNQTGDAELADAIEEAMGALRDSAMRNSSPQAVAAMEAADRGYAKLVRIEDAAKRRGGDAGTFSPTQYDAAVQNTAGGVRSRGYLSGEALNADIATLGKRLGDDLADSGSPERAFAGLTAAGGLGAINPKTLLPLGAYGLLNAPGVRNVTTGLMAPRNVPPVLQALAERLRGGAQIGGAIGGAGGLLGLTGPR